MIGYDLRGRHAITAAPVSAVKHKDIGCHGTWSSLWYSVAAILKYKSRYVSYTRFFQ